MKRIPQEEIERFINGTDPMERIVGLDYKYQDDFVTVIYRNSQDVKCKKKEAFHPFVWATRDACLRLCEGDRTELKKLMLKYHIGVKKLSNVSIEGVVRHEFDDGYMFMFFAKKPMSYTDFLSFFKRAKNPVFRRDDENKYEDPSIEKQYLIVQPQEQFLIATGKRFFKGYDDYDQLLRMTFDLETTGLDTEKDRIVQLGIRLNRPVQGYPNGFEKIFTVEGNTEEEKNKNELRVIRTLFKAIQVFQPDIISAHNGENFDWNMIIGACKRLGTSIEEESEKYFNGESIRKADRETILKLGGEMETFRETIVPYTIVTDSLHAVRRAQAIDSNMQKADLKYATEYSGLKKPNRVYTPGEKISEIWADTEHQYAFCEEDGDWYIYDPNCDTGVNDKSEFATEEEYKNYIKSIKSKQEDKPFKLKTRNILLDGYNLTTGRYIIERYLLDDVYECDKVEWKFNLSSFSICKALPVPYKKCTTMGTAGQWKALMMAWSYHNSLAIPPLKDTGSFTGGLSRLLKTGYVSNVVKNDFSSLYPSILLDWGISDPTDLLNSMLSFLYYFLTSRKKLKKKMKEAEKIVEKYQDGYINGTLSNEETSEYLNAKKSASSLDNQQLTRKIFCNSMFGSLSATKGGMFPWKSQRCGEQTTCTGRQCLRLMISHFKRLGYDPIVGDSVTGDTPLFIRYKDNGLIDIKPISEIFDNSSKEVDGIGREYDCSDKPYQVLCRSGWNDVKYVYRHKTGKSIYRAEDDNMVVDVTEDHSLFNSDKNKIKPTEINEKTELEYYTEQIQTLSYNITDKRNLENYAKVVAQSGLKIPRRIINANKETRTVFLEYLNKYLTKEVNINNFSKTFVAGYNFIKLNP